MSEGPGRVLNSSWLQNEALGPLTSFGVPARARYFTRLEQEDELPILLAQADHNDLPVLILGGGSNMLFTNDFQGLVIQIALRGISVRAESGASDWVLVNAAAGENWHSLVEYCLNHDLPGLENLALIPGSTGAAPVQNIGAYGVELAEVLHSVRYFDRRNQQVHQISADDCQLSYRDSIFKHALKNHAVILSVCLRLSRHTRPRLSYPALQQALANNPQPGARDVFDAVCAIRRSKLPDPRVLGNAGSFFRNPLVTVAKWQSLQQTWPDLPAYDTDAPDMRKLPAAWLIEKAGWKGARAGDAGVHTQQALVLVNHGQATGQQILALAQQVARSVKERFDISLEPEVNILPASAWHGR